MMGFFVFDWIVVVFYFVGFFGVVVFVSCCK